MPKHELLVPAGDMESLCQAIYNGADAIYLGCKSFGARKFAKNFTNDEIVEALKLAHLYGVKIYVTMNTLVKDDEVEDFLKQVEFLHKHGVDAILIQDFGMLCLVREKYPNLEVHASTQANTSSKETAELFYKLGVKRVVFSREMSLDEINSIDVPIEKEVFIHGALCISYSGCCLMSSMLGTRSGNRGECAGSCRLPYTLEKDSKIISSNKYLLSTKELNSAPHMQELLASDITSFKIEGRMKSPEYVGFITRYYRNLIDGTKVNLTEETDKLKTIFNREFTKGNLFSASKDELMNPKTPNHIGLEIGKVIGITPNKIKIKLSKTLNQQDAIRFLNSGKGFIVNFLYDEKDNLISYADNICYVDNKVNLTENDIVYKTQDYKLLNELKVLPQRKIPVTFNVKAYIGKPLEIIISDGKSKITELGTIVEKSINAPMSKERIITQIEKLGETPFISKNSEVSSDEEIFISIKELNDIRRTLVEKLIEKRTRITKEFVTNNVSFNATSFKEKTGITANVFTEEQLKTCLDLNLKRIYVEDKLLYEKYQNNSNIYYKIPRCTRNPKTYQKEVNLVSDYYIFNTDKEYIGDYPLNVYNIYTVYYLHKLNIKTVTLSVELTNEEIINLIVNYKRKFNTEANVEILAYGRVENMLIKGNILDIEKGNKNYKLADFKKRYFPVFYDGVNTHILNYENTKRLDFTLLNNISSIRLNFYDENATTIKKIVNQYQ